MYYKRVNRGLSFTKPGVYTFGLILAVGMIAVTTGINGLYVFLSAGLGGFIVSGLLSEKAMKSCRITQVGATVVDSGQSFQLSFTVENSSAWFSVFALQNLFLLAPPPFRLIAGPRPSFTSVKLARIPPASALTYATTSASLARGHYQRVMAMQLTTFPFGILEKFKLVEVPASLVVAPQLDRALLDELRALLRQKLGEAAIDREFYTHRAYTSIDAIRAVDWKKSAGRGPAEWVVKQFRSPSSLETLVLQTFWPEAVAQPSAEAYEAFLIRVRTALKALDETGRSYITDFGDGNRVRGYGECLAVLAGAPTFEHRADGLPKVANAGATADMSGAPSSTAADETRLVVHADAIEWCA